MARQFETFPYSRRAAEAREAMDALHATVRWARGTHGLDSRERDNAVEVARTRYYAALDAAYPPGFWDDYNGLRKGRPTGLEAAIAFLEADPWFFRSGYVKADLIRFIKGASLSPAQVARLQSVVLNIVDSRYRREFRSYCRMAIALDSAELRAELLRREESGAQDVARRAGWMLRYLDPQSR